MTQAGMLAAFEVGLSIMPLLLVAAWATIYWYVDRSTTRKLGRPEEIPSGVVAMSGGVQIAMQSGDPFQALLREDVLISPEEHPPQEAQRQISGTCTAVEVQGERVRFTLMEYPDTWFVCESVALVQCFVSHCTFSLPCLQPGDMANMAVLIADQDAFGEVAMVDWCMVRHQKPLTRGGDHE